MNDDFELPEANLEAETAVLGAAMLSADAAAEVVETLTAEHFLRPAHQIIFESISALLADGVAIPDPVAVKGELERRGEVGRVQGATTLMDILNATPTASNVTHWIRDVREAAGTRDGITAGIQIRRIYSHRDLDLEERHDAALQVLDKVTGGTQDETAQPVSNLITPFLDRLESNEPTPGVTTGWQDMDALLVKLRPGQLITVGARPGVGKTAAMINIALHVGLKLREPVLFASLEMSNDEILTRMLAHVAKVPQTAIEKKTLTDAQWGLIAKAAAELADAEHLVLDDTPGIGPGHLRARLRGMRRAGRPAALCCVDYLQLMNAAKKPENRQQEVSENCRALKSLAKEFEVPIVAGSQLNRESERRTDKRPMLSDLRESGAVEQDSDVVILLHREDVHERESPRAGEIDLIVAKHRQGATATITAVFQGHYSTIADMG